MTRSVSRLGTAAMTVLLLSGCGSQLVRSDADTNPFCLLVGGGIGAGTAAALGAATGPIGLGAVVGAMIGGLACPDHPPATVVAARTEYAAPVEPLAEPMPMVATITDADGDGIADGADQCPDTPKGSTVDRRGCHDLLLTLTGLNFKFDSSNIEPASVGALDDAIKSLNRYRGIDIRIEGHTDSVGTAAYNLALSQRRANAVLDYMARHGIKHERLTAVAMGERHPVAPNGTAEGRHRNRRVEFHVMREEN